MLLASLSSLELEVEPEDTCRISIGDVPEMVCALWICWFDVETRAIGDDICVRRTGLPPRWLAARPMNIGKLISISGCLRRVLKARLNDILAVFLPFSKSDLYSRIRRWTKQGAVVNTSCVDIRSQARSSTSSQFAVNFFTCAKVTGLEITQPRFVCSSTLLSYQNSSFGKGRTQS